MDGVEALSRLKQGFDSPRGRQPKQRLSSLPGRLTVAVPNSCPISMVPIVCFLRAFSVVLKRSSTHLIQERRGLGEPMPTAVIVAYVADAIGQPEAWKVIAKTVGTNLAYMARRHKTVVKIGERETARWALA